MDDSTAPETRKRTRRTAAERRIWLCVAPPDMRCSSDGLAALARDHLGKMLPGPHAGWRRDDRAVLMADVSNGRATSARRRRV